MQPTRRQPPREKCGHRGCHRGRGGAATRAAMGPRFPSLTGGAEPVTITIYRVSPSPRGAHLPHATPHSARLPGPAQNEQRAQFGSWTHSIVWLGKAGDSSLEDGGVLGLGDAGRVADRRVDDVEDRAPGPDVAHLRPHWLRTSNAARLASAGHLVVVEPGAGSLAGHPRAVVHWGRQPVPTVCEALMPWPVACAGGRFGQKKRCGRFGQSLPWLGF